MPFSKCSQSSGSNLQKWGLNFYELSLRIFSRNYKKVDTNLSFSLENQNYYEKEKFRKYYVDIPNLPKA